MVISNRVSAPGIYIWSKTSDLLTPGTTLVQQTVVYITIKFFMIVRMYKDE